MADTSQQPHTADEWLAIGLEARERGDHITAHDAFREGLAAPPSPTHIHLRIGLATTQIALGDYGPARRNLVETLGHVHARPRLTAGVRLMLAWLDEAAGDLLGARLGLHRALDELAATHDPRLLAQTLGQLGRVYLVTGRPRLASEFATAGLAVARRTSNALPLAIVHLQAAEIAHWRADLPTASTYARSALALGQEHELADAVAVARLLLGRIATRLGEHDLAQAHLGAALWHLDQARDRSGRAAARHALGRAALARHDVATAAPDLLACTAEHQALGEPIAVTEDLEALALLAAARGAFADAARLLGGAVWRRRRLGLPRPPIDRPAISVMIATCQAEIGRRRWLAELTRGQHENLDLLVGLVR